MCSHFVFMCVCTFVCFVVDIFWAQDRKTPDKGIRSPWPEFICKARYNPCSRPVIVTAGLDTRAGFCMCEAGSWCFSSSSTVRVLLQLEHGRTWLRLEDTLKFTLKWWKQWWILRISAPTSSLLSGSWSSKKDAISFSSLKSIQSWEEGQARNPEAWWLLCSWPLKRRVLGLHFLRIHYFIWLWKWRRKAYW